MGLEKAWKYCEERNMPRFIYISKTDEDNSDYNATFEALREPINDAGHVEQAFGQGGLAAAAVPQQTDVADVLYRIAHDSFHSFVY